MALPPMRKIGDQDELYNTPEVAMDAFTTIFPSFDSYTWWDPCDGLGGISDYLSEKGAKVYRSDTVKRRDCKNWLGSLDFLKAQESPADYLIFNPPFTLTEAFIDKAHELGKPFWMINRLTTLESKRALKFMHRWGMESVHVFSFRISFTKGIGRIATGRAVPYAWFHFDLKSKEPVIKWILPVVK